MCASVSTQGPPGERGERGEPGDEGYQVDKKKTLHQPQTYHTATAQGACLFDCCSYSFGAPLKHASVQMRTDHTCRRGLPN